MFLMNAKVVKGITMLFGLMLVVFGLNGFFQFLPAPSFNSVGSTFLGSLFSVGYIFTIINIVWILVGLSFIFNKFISLGGLVLAPISINILLFHLFLDSTGVVIGGSIFILNLYIIYISWNIYKPLFKY